MNELTQRCLHMDWDWTPTKRWIRVWIAVKMVVFRDLGYEPGELIIKKRGRGFHIWWLISKKGEFSEDEVNMLQWLCNDDLTRCRINRLRTRRGMKVFWNKIFSKVLWRKPLPKNCQKCHLIKTLKETEAEVVKEEGEYPEVLRFNPATDNVDDLKIVLGER